MLALSKTPSLPSHRMCAKAHRLSCLLTVGSTQFDKLVMAVVSEDCLRSLASYGVAQVFVQAGAGQAFDNILEMDKFAEVGLQEDGIFECSDFRRCGVKVCYLLNGVI